MGIKVLEKNDVFLALPAEIVPSVLVSPKQVQRGSRIASPDVVGFDKIIFFNIATIAKRERPVIHIILEGSPDAEKERYYMSHVLEGRVFANPHT